jgi:hypothetical protein
MSCKNCKKCYLTTIPSDAVAKVYQKSISSSGKTKWYKFNDTISQSELITNATDLAFLNALTTSLNDCTAYGNLSGASVSNVVLEIERFVAVNNQVAFTLANIAKGEAQMAINGVLIDANSYSTTNNVVNYTPANNSNYAIMAGDIILITYLK